MTVHLIHTTRHNPRPAMSEARRQHVNGRLVDDDLDPVTGALFLTTCAVGTMAAFYGIVLLVVGAGWL